MLKEQNTLKGKTPNENGADEEDAAFEAKQKKNRQNC